MNLSGPEFFATGSEPYRYPLAFGPEGLTLEGRKLAMAGKKGFVNQRGAIPTLLNVTNPLMRISSFRPGRIESANLYGQSPNWLYPQGR